jgi:hypothetical protein
VISKESTDFLSTMQTKTPILESFRIVVALWCVSCLVRFISSSIFGKILHRLSLPKNSFLVLLVNLDKSCKKIHKNLKFVVSDIHTVDKISKTRDSFMASVAFLSKACSTKYQQTNYESGQQIKVA